ncbi:hypothetical protein BLA60_22215 [Actinophytocola xinjiangensis]|uniref:Uncharacterized protein n=1 Tax=Actinophytocola xinjiangensis TaxID=485602 RepID=A0A7Z0WK72_9PSEU|nr:hypothetical protein [Actinophytocola xinjiangensis]OLF08732.1 hypothetical protein BLA60_22215 [Actinophytocola xinjiangensis]
MRVIRLGEESSKVGADVRAALASWGRGEGVVGGVALLGPQPTGSQHRVDAVVLLPRGVLVIAGVDLPDPAMRLDAPLTAQWKTDGWPLTRPDGVVNPAVEVIDTIATITRHLEDAKVEPLPVGTVLAVGPYVSQVHQPVSDLLRGVRVLHPEPGTLLTAARELATHPRPCTVRQARAILHALAPNNATLAAIDLAAEGFSDTAAARDLGTASTTVIPKITAARPGPARADGGRGGQLRWLPVSAAALVALLLLTGILYAVASAGDDNPEPSGGSGPTTVAASDVEIDGQAFAPKGTVADTDCAAHAYGDVQAWLERNRCGELVRMRYESTADDRRAAVLVAVLRFPEDALAQDLLAVADQPGAGAITDPSVEGEQWPGGVTPYFESAAYASALAGGSLTLVQAVWIGAPSTPDDADLTRLATLALDIPAPE